MEILKINNKEIVNSYLTPTLPYDIEGVLIEKNGKDIKIEKTIDNKTVEYSLRLKGEITANLGENIKIEKENIVSAKVEEKEETIKEDGDLRKAADIIKELGLEYTEENIRMIEFLLSSGITITRENVDSYLKSKEYLNKIIEGIDPNSLVKILDRGIDLEGESLQKIAQTLEEVKNEKIPFSLKRFLRLEKNLTYKEAEEIAREIYGQKMGKDVYDTIIALHKEKLPITRENIDKTIEVVSKLYNLKDLKDNTFVEVLNKEMSFNITNLYRLNNSYTITNIEDNVAAGRFEFFTIAKDVSMDREEYNKIIDMKEAVKELIELLGKEEIAKLSKKGIDLLDEDIDRLVEELKKEETTKELDKPIDEEKLKDLKEELEILGNIKDKDLLLLVKSGQDFTIKSIKNIIDTNIERELGFDHKVLDKTIDISKILNSLGEGLRTDTISFAVKRYDTITLQRLFMAQEEINTSQETVVPVDKIHEGLIFEEYLRARNNLTTNIIRESIKDGQTLEHMPLNELNNYIDKKINRYRDGQRLAKEIKDVKGNEERIFPIIMRNQISMTLREIKDINSFLMGEKGLANIMRDITESNNPEYSEEFKEGIKLIQEKISTSIKEGDHSFKDNYKELMNLLNNHNNFDNKKEDSKEKEYLKIQSKVSKKDIVFQLPIKIGDEYKSLNIIVPDVGKGIDKNNMKFFLSLEADNIGQISMELNIKSREIKINIDEQGNALRNRLSSLEKGLQAIGYTLSNEVIL